MYISDFLWGIILSKTSRAWKYKNTRSILYVGFCIKNSVFEAGDCIRFEIELPVSRNSEYYIENISNFIYLFMIDPFQAEKKYIFDMKLWIGRMWVIFTSICITCFIHYLKVEFPHLLLVWVIILFKIIYCLRKNNYLKIK